MKVIPEVMKAVEGDEIHPFENPRFSKVFGTDNLAIKRFEKECKYYGYEDFGRFGDAVHEYVMLSHVQEMGYPVPEPHGIILLQDMDSFDYEEGVLEESFAKDYLTPLLVMDRIENAGVPVEDREEWEEKCRERVCELYDKGIDINDCSIKRNLLYNPEEEEIYFIDAGRWEALRPSFEELLQEHPPVIYDPKGRSMTFDGETLTLLDEVA